MEIGNIVAPTDTSGFVLRSGAQQYNYAVVISLHPFVITSEDADMRWESTVKQEDFIVVGAMGGMQLENCLKRL